ncbi:MAG: AtpZ/AtpI family protein [Ruminiclostridium sp.]|nr:AtpZ/AtpI family protein [Ruminiclostridium sp.]
MEKKDNKGENPVKTYAIVSQLGFNIITPLLIFIWGGSVLVSKMGLPDWVMALFVVTGIFVMLCGTISYLLQLIKRYDKGDDKKAQKVVSSRRDNDYYDDSIRKKYE